MIDYSKDNISLKITRFILFFSIFFYGIIYAEPVDSLKTSTIPLIKSDTSHHLRFSDRHPLVLGGKLLASVGGGIVGSLGGVVIGGVFFNSIANAIDPKTEEDPEKKVSREVSCIFYGMEFGYVFGCPAGVYLFGNKFRNENGSFFSSFCFTTVGVLGSIACAKYIDVTVGEIGFIVLPPILSIIGFEIGKIPFF